MDRKHDVWIVDDDRSIRWVLEKALMQADMNVTSFDNAETIMARLRIEVPDVIISDIRMPGSDGLTMLKEVKRDHPNLPVIIMTAYSDLDRAVASFKEGAFEYLSKPFDVDEVVGLVQRAVTENHRRAAHESEGVEVKMPEIIGAAPAMQEVFRAIGRLARSHVTVLITGESGTGKELVARALHRHSLRAGKPFIALNTAAIPRDLLESELFGHERGAFTGAAGERIGRFEQANGGTLFLDEIGDMPAELQTRLLRVLAEGDFYRVGGQIPITVDVRVIAATHQDLDVRVKNGAFREDLFHRLNVIRVHLPAIRERREDIPSLAKHFLTTAAKEPGVLPKTLLPEAEAFLKGLDWPGNVRQIENVCRWVTVMAPSQEIRIGDLPPELRGSVTSDFGDDNWERMLRAWVERCLSRGEIAIVQQALPRFERIMIEAALDRTGGRRQDAAKFLGWGRNTLTRKIRELGIDQ
ncbi:MAG: nitrogen regulation protein NR(I) [Gammaproteobacteria bacterium]|nr:nitrogen regulation protein NR(I) [Gammaproteobacteria bacterium]MCI0590834.1 nitrogen regulation protein NR(I) [Gammaproteobacteria bacterium]